MDNQINLYSINKELVEKVMLKIEDFNCGRRQETGYYAISIATTFRSYYGLWRIFSDKSSIPLFIKTLALNLEEALNRTFIYLKNCNVTLKLENNSFFEPYYGRADDIISFGKYQGKRLADVYYVDPHYVLWLGSKFEARNKRDIKLAALAKGFCQVYFETIIHKKNIPAVSCHIGKVGEKLFDLKLTVLSVKLQLDTYKKDYYVDQNVLATDIEGNRFSFIIKAAAPSLNPYVLSCYSRAVYPRDILNLVSAKVLSHYQNKGVNYTRIGYMKFSL